MGLEGWRGSICGCILALTMQMCICAVIGDKLWWLVSLTLQVNNQDIVGWSHETAAKALKTAGTEVTLRVIYKPEGLFLFHTCLCTSTRVVASDLHPVSRQVYM